MTHRALRAELAALRPELAEALDALTDTELRERLSTVDTPAVRALLERHPEPTAAELEPVVVTIGLDQVAPEVVLTRSGIEVRLVGDRGTPVVLRSLAPALLSRALKEAARLVNSRAHRAKLT